MSGGYDPTETAEDSAVIRAQQAVFTRIERALIRSIRAAPAPGPASSSPANRLQVGAGQFGLGHGSGAHAPDEFFIIESRNPRVAGLREATMGYVDFLYEMATIR